MKHIKQIRSTFKRVIIELSRAEYRIHHTRDDGSMVSILLMVSVLLLMKTCASHRSDVRFCSVSTMFWTCHIRGPGVVE